jgi:hypothetical protein
MLGSRRLQIDLLDHDRGLVPLLDLVVDPDLLREVDLGTLRLAVFLEPLRVVGRAHQLPAEREVLPLEDVLRRRVDPELDHRVRDVLAGLGG